MQISDGTPSTELNKRVFERDALLAAKLHVPAPRPGAVGRQRLVDQLAEGMQRPVLLVCAPAGYGKTVLLGGWVRSSDHRAAWLSLDLGDNDPARFWRYVLTGLERVSSGIMERVAPLLGPPAPPSFEPLVAALVNEFADDAASSDAASSAAAAAPALLVLDDYHLIDSPGIHESVAFLLEHLPAGLRLALSTRSDPPLPLARWRARGQLTELRADQLRFTPAEAAALLRDAAGAGAALPANVVAELTARTEGWAAGLQLAALSLRGHLDPAAFAAQFTGSHRYVLDYLTEEVLHRQNPPVREFLLETSVLQRLSGELCDAVTGRTGSQAMLEEVERAGLFLLPLDETRGWWRYHHLFADLLRARLGESQPGHAERLHQAAATWHEQRGWADEAIHHALAAHDMPRAARLVEEHFDAVFNLRGEQETIRRWLPALADDVVRTRPRLLLAQAQMAGMRGDLDTMQPLLDAAERASADPADEPFKPSTGPAASLLINVPAVIALQRSYIAQFRDDPEATEHYATQALAQLRDGELMLRSVVREFLAMSQWLRGRLAAAEHAFAADLADSAEPTNTAWINFSLTRIQCARGRLGAALESCQTALERVSAPGRPPVPAAGPALVGLAEVAYQRNDLDIARSHVTSGIAACRQFVYQPPLAAGLVRLAWIRQACGDPAGAREAIAEAELATPGRFRFLNPVPAQRARLLLAQGDLAAAARWTADSGLDADDEPSYPRQLGHVILARVLLAQDRPDRALVLLDRLHAAALAQDRTGEIIEVGALRALALAAVGQQHEALTALAAALTLARPERNIRVFADEGQPMAVLLDELITARRAGHAAGEVPVGWLATVHHALHHDSNSAPRPTQGGLIEPLTPREAQVLNMIASGHSNQAIAETLVITLDTVKKHVSHLLDKLGATNRTAAVARARELHLLS